MGTMFKYMVLTNHAQEVMKGWITSCQSSNSLILNQLNLPSSWIAQDWLRREEPLHA